ncbi:MAG: thymidine phosphorylase [Candidatus Diapherotrites archaeon]|nr:thymidine phosphorylase [Candidatus Diapherotrites archaeon]
MAKMTVKEFFLKLKAKVLDIEAKKLVCILNEKDAKDLGIIALERIQIVNQKNKKSIHAVVDTTQSIVKNGELGLFKDVAKALKAKNGTILNAGAQARPKSISYIKAKLDRKKLSEQQIKEIVQDISTNRLSDVETTAFVTSVYTNGFDLKETVAMTKALAQSGQKISFTTSKKVVDKHSVGGTNGRTTLVIVPIIASSGLLIPKTSSRTITSASGTADAMEVLAPVNLSIWQIKKITQKIGGAIAWGGAVDLAPVDDKIIKIEHPLSLDPHGQVIASVMAKKFSAGAKYVLIDLPVGPEMKVKTLKQAKIMSKKFAAVGKELGIKVKTVTTKANSPSGKAFGPALEAKYALEVLEGKFFDNFAEKCIKLSGELLELAGAQKRGKGYNAALQMLESGMALQKMRQIIKAQGGRTFSSSQIKSAPFKKTFFAQKNGKIKQIHVRKCTSIARASGAPTDKKAGLFLKVENSGTVIKGQPIFEIYAQNQQKLLVAAAIAKQLNPIEIK